MRVAVCTATLVLVALSTGGGADPARSKSALVFADAHENVWVAVVGESGRRLLVRGGSTPTWSPDGGRVAYAWHVPRRSAASSAIWIVQADGTRRAQLTHPDSACVDLHPSWSPDGRSIVFARECADVAHDSLDVDLFTVDTGSGKVSPLTSTPDDWEDSPSVSPDGSEVAFMLDDGIHALALPTKTLRRVTHALTLAGDNEPAWSPDGLRIAYARDGKGVTRAVFVARRDGGNARRLTGWGANYAPVWSPDGRSLAVTVIRPDKPSATSIQSTLRVINAATGKSRFELADAGDADWR